MLIEQRADALVLEGSEAGGPIGPVAAPDWLPGILFGAVGLTGMYLGAKMQKNTSECWMKLIPEAVLISVASNYILRFFG